DHHLPEAYDLLQLFRFIPDARLDDIMLSLASHGGGVGPHYDSYDVFLLQMHGKRRWKIGPLTDNTLKKDAPLKILEHFTPTEEFLLEPGDMLYLPPNYGHDGVAEGVCTTLSVGFRALNKAEVVSGILHDFADRIQSDETLKKQLFSDPGRGLQSKPANLPDDMIEFALTLMREFKPGEDEIADSLGKMLTEPKPIVYYENNTEDMTIEEIRHTLIERGIALSMKTRMLVGKTSVFINGECVKPERKETYEFLSNLANSRQLEPKEVNSAFVNEETAFFVIGFAKAGWIDTLF
ncbi:MAG TPA: cupin domain-containing protein, partial [Limnobacter sp.]|uniref:cupin domain-containing protein n=1 Tax=Limnobacter sp. TaxID=2003368 RepID=UPI002E30E194